MMNLNEVTAVCAEAGAAAEQSVSLADLTTFKIGGACRALVTVPTAEACQKIVGYLRKQQIPFSLIGRGSNLLCPDEGYDGVILKLGGALAAEPELQNGLVVCGAGTALKTLCLFACNHSLTGLEFAYGIPGTVGGAVFMNAGAYGGEMSQVLESVQVLDDAGNLRELPASALALGYRHSVFMEQDWLILSASVKLEEGCQDAVRAQMQDLIGRRKEKQPLEFPSAGSTFKRPEGSYASKQIDECGLKGLRVGDAQVSEKHAGFVINRGQATFADVMALCAKVQEIVLAQTGYRLELEPEILRTEK